MIKHVVIWKIKDPAQRPAHAKAVKRALESLRSAFGRQVTPLQLPIGKEKSFTGVVDLVRMKAYAYELGGNGQGKEGEIPANIAAAAQEAHEKLVELVAEGDDQLMEEFFEKGTIPEEHLIPALHDAIRDDKIFPVLYTSGLGNIGVDKLMDFLVDYTPAGTELGRFLAPHGLAVDRHGDIYVGEVSWTAWPQIYPGNPHPANLRSLQKFAKRSNKHPRT